MCNNLTHATKERLFYSYSSFVALVRLICASILTVYSLFCVCSLSLIITQLESLPQMVDGVNSPDPAVQLDATTRFRKLLSIERTRRLRRSWRLAWLGSLWSFYRELISRSCSLKRVGVDERGERDVGGYGDGDKLWRGAYLCAVVVFAERRRERASGVGVGEHRRG